MILPKAEKKKLLSKKEFVALAKKVRESFEEQDKYLRELKLKHGDTLSSHIYHNS